MLRDHECGAFATWSIGLSQSWQIQLSRSNTSCGLMGSTVAATSRARCRRLTSRCTQAWEHHLALAALLGRGVNTVPHSGHILGSGVGCLGIFADRCSQPHCLVQYRVVDIRCIKVLSHHSQVFSGKMPVPCRFVRSQQATEHHLRWGLPPLGSFVRHPAQEDRGTRRTTSPATNASR
jgi:hypothetical protein